MAAATRAYGEGMSRPREGRGTTTADASEPHEIAGDGEARRAALLATRLRLGVWMLLAAWAVFLLLELFLVRERPLPVLGIKTVQLAGLLAVLGLVRPGRSRRSAIRLALATVWLVCLTTALTGAVADEISSASLLLVVLVVSTSVLLPWGPRPQACTAVAAASALALNAALVSRLPADFAFSVAVVLAAICASLYVARETEHEERRREGAECALRAGERLRRAIVEAAPEAVLLLARDGAIAGWHAAAERTLGLRRDGPTPPRIVDVLLPQGARDLQREAIERDLRAGGGPMLGRGLEVAARRADGGALPAELTIVPLVDDAGGQPVLFAAYLRDQTELRAAQQAADATPHILYLYDVGQGRVTYVNRQVSRILGYGGDYILNHGIEFLIGVIHPDDVERTVVGAQERLREISEDGVVEAELRVKHRNGEWRWIHCRNVVFTRGDDGLPTQILGTAQDVSERKQAEELVRAHEAELAHVLRVATLGEMAAGFAHELNQPLASIVSFAKGCARRLQAGGVDPESFVGIMEQIASEALRAGEIIRRLRTLVRNGCEAMDDLPESERVLTLLTSSGGPDAVILAVHDRGKGLGDAGPERIFEPFFTTKASGLGMGLAISRSIAERHGGRLLAMANHDRGVTFQLVLPCGKAAALDPGPAVAAGAGSRPL